MVVYISVPSGKRAERKGETDWEGAVLSPQLAEDLPGFIVLCFFVLYYADTYDV